ncbi:MAG: response regulator [Caldilinea sp.]|nr:response regulator [Caldilinea sp.]MDW8438976.1 response regulator [Caldilineaceae bacterium]
MQQTRTSFQPFVSALCGHDHPSPLPSFMSLETKDYTVLIVEDEDTLRQACADVLDAFGYRVLLAANGEEAIQVLEEKGERIDCVILDLTMPGMNGAAAYAEMRKIKPDLRVLVTSGHDVEDALRHFPADSVFAYIQKPYSIYELHRRLQEMLTSSASGKLT